MYIGFFLWYTYEIGSLNNNYCNSQPMFSPKPMLSPKKVKVEDPLPSQKGKKITQLMCY